MKKIAFLFIFTSLSFLVKAQSQTYSNTDAKTGVKITTKISPLPNEITNQSSLTEQIASLENLLQASLQNPSLVADGTANKYQQVLQQKKSEWAAQQNKNLAPKEIKKTENRKSISVQEKPIK